MPNILRESKKVLNTHDTLIFTETETNEQCYEKLNNELTVINVWLKKNKLKLNENKSKNMKINTDTYLKQ